ncbi:MAG: 1-deoxy-D-xylulose-5-phosphate synthase [Anaerotruncus sp.]|nr:1-deoxy-D-xylulose-5-phosphate synthase [Anaerotruncus sp.]
MANYNLLQTIRFPDDLHKLNPVQQKNLCWEIRQQLIRTISQNGGHLASNLGVVELTLALHLVFDLPQDQLVWDVGHQCYTHKILSGRLKEFSALRQEDGLSGFPRPGENQADAFIAGHASTSISAACGLAKAKTLAKDPHHVIAVVGDGSFTGGMVYEAINNAGRSNDRLIVILNDNEMSISESVGAFARYLAEKRTSDSYNRMKDTIEHTVRGIPVIGQRVRDLLSGSKAVFRQALYHSNFFEDFGFDYFGPVDGHDLPLLIQTLTRAKKLNKPVFVHVNTVKGKGYVFAENDPSRFHGVGSFDCVSGELGPARETFSSHFGKQLLTLAKKDKSICAITAAMRDGTGLSQFAQEFTAQNRFFDVGIAEEHAVTFACGLAAGGFKPVFAVYSTFLQRGYDQLIHDASIERQHVVLAVDRAGIVGEDGETHQGLFDTAFLSNIPGILFYAPCTYAELDYALKQALYQYDGLAAIRYPRGSQLDLPFDLGAPADYLHLKNGGDTLLVTYGREFEQVYQASEHLARRKKPVDVLKLLQIAPIPEVCIQIAKKYRTILFVEEGLRCGGIGEHFMAALAETRYRGRVVLQAIENPFIPQMLVASALQKCGLDTDSLLERLYTLYF